MTTEEKLQLAIKTLKDIRFNDPGPAHWVAKGCLDMIIEEKEEKTDQLEDTERNE